MESAGLTIENKNTGCRELEYQALGTGVPDAGNWSTRYWEQEYQTPGTGVPDTGTTELRASLQKNTGASRLNSLLIAPGKTTEQEVQFFLQAEEQP